MKKNRARVPWLNHIDKHKLKLVGVLFFEFWNNSWLELEEEFALKRQL